jgi:putative membrane protein
MISPLKSNLPFRASALLLPLALAAALSACDRPGPPSDPVATAPEGAVTPPDPNDQASVSGTTDAATDPTMPSAPMPGDTTTNAATGQAEALALLVAVNEHEIAAAEQARSKGVDGEVREFADLMHREHSKNLAETQALAPGAPGSSAQVTKQREKGTAEIDRLAALEAMPTRTRTSMPWSPATTRR